MHYSKVKDMDHLRAMIKLGFMHFYGEGCEKEIPLACKYVDYLLKLKDFEKDPYDYMINHGT